MTLKVKSVILMVVGGLLIALALYYGMSGSMSSNISKRGENIARWEKELVQARAKLETLMADVDQLGKKADPTPDERRKFGFLVSQVERDTEHLRFERERIEDERDRKTQMIMITAGLVLAGAVAILIGFLLRRRSSVAIS